MIRVHPTTLAWTLTMSAIGGGAAWAVGLPAAAVAGVGLAMAGAGVVAELVGPQRSLTERDASGAVIPNTTQHSQLMMLWSYLDGIRSLTIGPNAAGLSADAARSALEAGQAAHQSAIGVCASVDTLDAAIERGQNVSQNSQGASAAVTASLSRMRARRSSLLNRLTEAVDEIAGIYGQLLELSTTESTLQIGTGPTDISAVRDSITAMSGVFRELEAESNRELS